MANTKFINPNIFYNQVAQTYENFNKHFYQKIAAGLLALIPIETPINSILEIGAGTGFATLLIKNSYPQAKITALEPSESMLNIAKQKISGVNWKLQSFEEFVPQTKPDLIFCSMAAHWLTTSEWQKLISLSKNSTIALALPSVRKNSEVRANQILKKILFKLKTKSLWAKESRNLKAIAASKVKKLTFSEQYSDNKKLVESLYNRGVFLALFGQQAIAAKNLFYEKLEKESPNQAIFDWSFKLIINR